MEKNLYIDAAHPNETRFVLKSKNHIEEYEYENKKNLHIKSNIYLGKISRVEPSLQAAFIDFGRQRHGFLAFNDIQTDYYLRFREACEHIFETCNIDIIISVTVLHTTTGSGVIEPNISWRQPVRQGRS